MKILVFAAAVTAAQVAAVGRLVTELREAGHTAGERSLPHFRLEREPADALLIAMNAEQGAIHKARLLELQPVFGDIDYFGVELPADDKELADFDFSNVIGRYDDKTGPGYISIEQAKAEAVSRGLEVTSATTRDELERMLGIDIHPGSQAFDRRSDRENNADGSERRIGLQTSHPLPTTNGMDITRLNDEQLAAYAVQAGLKVTSGMRRNTILNKLMEKFGDLANVDPSKLPKAGDGEGDNTFDEQGLRDELGKLSDKKLKDRAAADGVDLGDATTSEQMIDKIVEAKKAPAGGNA